MRKHYSAAFKAQLVQEVLKEDKSITQIAAENGLHPNQLSQWKTTALRGLATLFERESKTQADQAAHEKQREELYATIGKLTTQLAWLKKKSGLDPQ
jgi:transposase-like protein